MENTSTRRGFTQQGSLLHLRKKVAGGRMRGNLAAFTLIELVIAVLIIGILAAVAVPQYQKAVLKSRFSTVMPVAKAVAEANEVYYLGKNMYALSEDELDVAPVTSEHTTVTLSQTDGYDYVLAQRGDVEGMHYIVYQKHSENYPDEIHCEAADNNDDAQWLCGVLSNNNSIGQTITAGYTTYLINGTGAGIVPGVDEDDTNESGETVVSCTNAEAMGYTCNITTNAAGQQEKHICTKAANNRDYCQIKIYQEEGAYTLINCSAQAGGTCTSGNMRTYDASGKITSDFSCSSFAEDLSCTSFPSGDAHMKYGYENGKLTSATRCKTVNPSDLSCDGYESHYDFSYTDGKLSSWSTCSRSITSTGTCSSYDITRTYTYDTDGNRSTQLLCNGITNKCFTYHYAYDDKNRVTSFYNGSTNNNYRYDDDGNRTFSAYCNSVDGNGKCVSGTYTNSYEYTYSDDGNAMMVNRCWGSNIDQITGKCNAYDQVVPYQQSVFESTDEEIFRTTQNA